MNNLVPRSLQALAISKRDVKTKLEYDLWYFQFAAKFSNGLASFRFDSLFDYGNELQDIQAVNIVNRHYQDLMRIVQPQLQETNQKRKEHGDLTYPYMIPRWIPNGVQT